MFYAINKRIDVIRTFDTVEAAKAFVEEAGDDWIVVDEDGRLK